MTTAFRRYAVLSITLFAMTTLVGNSVLFNFTVICMHPSNQGLNATRMYSAAEEGWMIAAPQIGLIFGTPLIVFVNDRIGTRLSFPIFGFISALSTIIFAFSASHIYAAILLRFIQGAATINVFIAIGNVPIVYGDIKRKALFVSLLSVAHQLGPISAIPSSALFCESSLHWNGVYYFFGVITMLAFVGFFAVYRNNPDKIRSSSTMKVVPMEDGMKIKNKSRTPPYRAIFTTPSVLGLLCTAVGDALSYMVFFFYGPIYVNKVLHFEIKETGILAALPYLVSMMVKTLTGLILHHTSFKDSPRVVFISKVVVQAVMTVAFVILLTIGSDSPMIAEVLIIVAVALSGLHYIFMMIASQIVAQQYTHVIASTMAAVDSVFGLLLPTFVSLMAPNHTADEWAHVFYCIIGILIATNIAFVVLTRLRPEEWTKEDLDKSEVDAGK
ncbi:hypothetical protein QR680_010587 [Steinernema hermaphroditum]|uniref:Major facilitator superfamily (MFS) profile domain-containing protein n=1 Tax=Steinernema hermaphroditum TaxID=289476 RepID=A0AA39MC25_9BILA|nr:hypothetical protein QR680_010587 [Steinernema hermaphroditum]